MENERIDELLGGVREEIEGLEETSEGFRIGLERVTVANTRLADRVSELEAENAHLRAEISYLTNG